MVATRHGWVVVDADGDRDFKPSLSPDEFFARGEACALDAACGPVTVAGYVADGEASFRESEPSDLIYRRGTWSARDSADGDVAAYVQRLWDRQPSPGDEAALLRAMLEECEDGRRPRRMADAIALDVGIPGERWYGLLTSWSFWDYGVSARTGWFKSPDSRGCQLAAARAHLALLEGGR